MKPTTKAWLDKSERDLEAAHWDLQKTGSPLYDDVCFHCQQCVEKAMKAVLAERGVSFPKTHDLKVLAPLIVAAAPGWTAALHDLNILYPGAVEYRYPGNDATQAEALDALSACARIRASLLPLI